jgi:dihydrofolate reductase
MRLVRYNVAASLDGCIATADGGYDWIPEDSTIDFGALFAKVDTVLLGRHSYLLTQQVEEKAWSEGTRVYVFSTTLRPGVHPDVTIVRANVGEVVAALRAEPGDGDIWLFGGGRLFSSLLAAGQVDRVEVTVAPVLLGGGIPLSVPGTPLHTLRLIDTTRYPSGMVTLNYDVLGADR